MAPLAHPKSGPDDEHDSVLLNYQLQGRQSPRERMSCPQTLNFVNCNGVASINTQTT